MSTSEQIAKEIFAGIGSAKASFASNYFRAGHYIWLINQIKADKNRKHEPFMVIECTCVHAFDDGNGLGHKPGEDASWLRKAMKDSFLGNVKRMVSNILGVPTTEVSAEACVTLCSDAQPLSGWFVETVNRQVPMKEKNDDGSPKLFTQVDWKNSVSNTMVKRIADDEILARMFPEGLEDDEEDDEEIPF